MRKSVKYLARFAVVSTLFATILAGCGSKQAMTNNVTATSKNLSLGYKNPAKPIKGGTFTTAMVQDTPFTGQFLPEVELDLADSYLTAPLTPGATGSYFATNSEFKIVDGGAANITLDKNAKTATIKLHKGLTWSDGKKVVAKDLEFPYEIEGNPAYQSQQWSSQLENIVGMTDFHNGKAKTISGITYPNGENGDSIKIQFKMMTPGMWQQGSGYYIETAEPYHYLKDIKPADLAASKQARQAPLSDGPFKVEKVVAGQSVSYVPNPYWYGKKSSLKRLVMEVVSTSSAAAGLKDKKYDLALGVPNNAYPVVKALKDYTQTVAPAYSYINFNLGHYDAQKQINVTDRKTPLQNVALRQAMAYALNTDQVNKQFNHGLQTRANTTVPPVFTSYRDASIKGYNLDISKANSLLDQAGFKWDANHKFRLTPEGKPFKLTFMAQQADNTSNVIAQNDLQQWKKIGVDVALYKGRTTDMQTWRQIMTTGTSNDWDLASGSWYYSRDPSQMQVWGKAQPYNFGHFTTPELEKLLAACDAPAAINPKVRQQAFYKFQAYMNEQVPQIPVSYMAIWYPVNKRVVGYTNDNAAAQNLWSQIGVTSPKIQ